MTADTLREGALLRRRERDTCIGLATGASARSTSCACRLAQRCPGGPWRPRSWDGPALAAKLTTRARVASALLRRGQHVVHMLEPGHSAWLHVVVGTVLLGELALTTGDGVALLDELALSVTARGDCELLLVELEPRAASGRPRVSSH
jgi:hypothetical protein